MAAASRCAAGRYGGSGRSRDRRRLGMAAERVVEILRDQKALLGPRPAPSAVASSDSASRSADCAGAPRRKTAARVGARDPLDEALGLADPRSIEDGSRPQEQQPGRARRCRSRLEPLRQRRAVHGHEIAAGDIRDRRGLVARAAVGHQHFADQARRRARTPAPPKSAPAARSESWVAMMTLSIRRGPPRNDRRPHTTQ